MSLKISRETCDINFLAGLCVCVRALDNASKAKSVEYQAS